MMTPAPQIMVWSFGEWQCSFDSIPNVEFVEGLPQRENFDGKTKHPVDSGRIQRRQPANPFCSFT